MQNQIWVKKLALVLTVLVLAILAGVATAQAQSMTTPPTLDWTTWFSGTFAEFLAVVISAATIAIGLERLPFWTRLDAQVKLAVVGFLNVLAPFVLQAVLESTPAEVLQKPAVKVLVGLAGTALSFVAHQLDAYVSAKASSARAEARLQTQRVGNLNP